MSLDKAIGAGLLGNEASKKITGSNEVSAGRTAVATGSGAIYGATAAGVLVIAGASTPVTVPLTVGGAVVGAIASLFD